VRIEIDRQIEVGEREDYVTTAIRQDAPFSIVFGVVHREVAIRGDTGGRQSAVCILRRCIVSRCYLLFGGLRIILWLIGSDICTLVAQARWCVCIG
jgi:hypothetical protein